MDECEEVRQRHRPIIAFHQDDQGDWVADLACGHTRHMRHNPPWIERPWVMTADGRQDRFGDTLDCRQCDAEARSKGERTVADGSLDDASGAESAHECGGDA
jgi:Protein of unknown function (DUF3565)